MTDFEYMEKIRQDAALTVVEFTSLMPIHRTTYYGWLRGTRAPDALRLRLCVARTRAIEAAVKDGLLPVADSITAPHRMWEIKQALHRQKSNS